MRWMYDSHRVMSVRQPAGDCVREALETSAAGLQGDLQRESGPLVGITSSDSVLLLFWARSMRLEGRLPGV